MNKLSQVIATVTAVAAIGFVAAPAHAQEATYDYPQAVASSTTRAQVQAELKQARADGSIRVWSTSYNPLAVAKSLKSRAEVQGELHGAGAAAAAAILGQDSGSFALSNQPVRGASTMLAGR